MLVVEVRNDGLEVVKPQIVVLIVVLLALAEVVVIISYFIPDVIELGLEILAFRTHRRVVFLNVFLELVVRLNLQIHIRKHFFNTLHILEITAFKHL